jgi:hypothetical protein
LEGGEQELSGEGAAAPVAGSDHAGEGEHFGEEGEGGVDVVWKAGDAALQKPFFRSLEMVFADIEISLRRESSPEEIKREGEEDCDGRGFEPAEGACIGIDLVMCLLWFGGVMWEWGDGFGGRFGFAEQGEEGECERSEECGWVDPAGESGDESGEGEDGKSGADGEDERFESGEWQL